MLSYVFICLSMSFCVFPMFSYVCICLFRVFHMFSYGFICLSMFFMVFICFCMFFIVFETSKDKSPLKPNAASNFQHTKPILQRVQKPRNKNNSFLQLKTHNVMCVFLVCILLHTQNKYTNKTSQGIFLHNQKITHNIVREKHD